MRESCSRAVRIAHSPASSNLCKSVHERDDLRGGVKRCRSAGYTEAGADHSVEDVQNLSHAAVSYSYVHFERNWH